MKIGRKGSKYLRLKEGGKNKKKKQLKGIGKEKRKGTIHLTSHDDERDSKKILLRGWSWRGNDGQTILEPGTKRRRK